MPDYIIIGGGSAGCTIAGRLGEDTSATIELFETGPSDKSPWIHLPVTYYKTCTTMLHRYALEPQPHLAPPTAGAAGGGFDTGQAAVLGGGSSVNAMVYIRGCPEDYDGWRDLGAEGWGYDQVLPYFRKAEGNESLAGPAHGTDGPLGVSDQRNLLPLTKAWIKACQEMGMPYNPDFNSGSQAGAGPFQMTARNGRRCSAAVAYLHPTVKRGNVKVHTGKKVLRILITAGRATGIEYLDGNRVVTLHAEREVILTSGAIGSPTVLLRSGIGPADELRSVGVKVEHDLPGVGKNLQDHTDCYLLHELSGATSYDKYKKLHWQAVAAARYALFRNGPIASNICEAGAFWHGDPSDPVPDLQYHFLAGAGVEEGAGTVPGGNGCTVNVYACRPKSRGEVRLRSADPMTEPLVDPRYLSDPYDVDRMVDGVRIGQEIMAQPSIRKFIRRDFQPAQPLKTRAEYEAFVHRYTQGAYHLSGACRMGEDDMAVVDSKLRVRGIDGLRLADSSIMPRVVSGNLNAPTIMIGERAAEFIKGNRA